MKHTSSDLRQPSRTTNGLPDATVTFDNRIVPFDQVVTFDLSGRPQNVLSNVINISIEGYFVAVAMSYSIIPDVQLDFGPETMTENDSLGDMTARNIVEGFLIALKQSGLSEAKQEKLALSLMQTGIRLNPDLAHQIFSQGGLDFRLRKLGKAVSRIFRVAACANDRVEFLYTISDNATGRDFQSDPVHNIAGLGIANGDRPFRYFPQPIVFMPRSAIRVSITEISGTGRLYFVLQGYKVLGTARQVLEAARQAII